jgi:hypothetical protein
MVERIIVDLLVSGVKRGEFPARKMSDEIPEKCTSSDVGRGQRSRIPSSGYIGLDPSVTFTLDRSIRGHALHPIPLHHP